MDGHEFDVIDWLIDDAIQQRPSASLLHDAHTRGADPAQQHQSQAGQMALPLLQLADWDKDRAYDEQPPTCIHYSIEWELILNDRVLTRDTEQDLVLAPGSFWDITLRPKLERLLEKKLPPTNPFNADETKIVISVTDRAERDHSKRFEELDIDWPFIGKQLQGWGYFSV
jgi:hypothetical protein